MSAELFRDTAVGAVLRYITKNRVLQFPEERADFQIPELWQQMLNGEVDVSDDVDGNETDINEKDKGGDAAGAGTSSDDEKQGNDASHGNNNDEENGGASGDSDPYAALRRASTARSRGAGSLQHQRSREETLPYTQARLDVENVASVERTQSQVVVPRLVKTRTGTKSNGAGQPAAHTYETAIVVDWYSTDDRSNPQNWRLRRRIGVGFIIWLYTFCVYMSSAIYTNSEQGVMETFGVDATNAALGLSIFVLGYGVGPLIFSPLSEIPSIGRNPVYAVTMIFFVIFSLPASLAYGNLPGGFSSGNFGGFIMLRFLQGFFGSPCLASGAASLGDMFSLLHLPYALAGWVSAGFSAPALGPLLSGYSVPAKGWRWSMLEILWAAAPCTIVMLLFLPETSAPNILLRRARRLRKITGSDRFRAPSELADYNELGVQTDGKPKQSARSKAFAVLIDALIKPIEITLKDPAVLFVQVYSAIVYGIYYSFFEAFPLVYPVAYGMSPGQVGLVFTCILVACLLGIAMYCLYVYFILNRKIARTGQFPPNEDRLIPAMLAAFGPTFGLFIFGWTAEHAPKVPWIAPTIGITLYGATVFVVLQCIFVYIPLSYPMYAASLFAANDFFRSAFATGSILFGRPLFMNLGIGRGTSVLGGLSVIGIVGIWLLYFYGARLRAMSKFAVS
ncbi:uncharacterized protein SPSK_08776 [Sporothrix schenckii 1099-18]|uniref:Major facilitator superfamily (MFS) profile domain-containing protein n=2 Tax=Sporothrix schenckii TaxID=29908 RepID=U7PYB9_SPOS1|nr:uncharacterized protein SPSK_08776 [Sporothrix schenckii 1099-18]ERS99911.1 hypothetical protein HMPREF1624_03279 [Sporothrix schenckii ATCC 58251]KJR85688.1 hypothetical protein SPSK_08776 [Sporothrix schenckii 1099-18]